MDVYTQTQKLSDKVRCVSQTLPSNDSLIVSVTRGRQSGLNWIEKSFTIFAIIEKLNKICEWTYTSMRFNSKQLNTKVFNKKLCKDVSSVRHVRRAILDWNWSISLCLYSYGVLCVKIFTHYWPLHSFQCFTVCIVTAISAWQFWTLLSLNLVDFSIQFKALAAVFVSWRQKREITCLKFLQNTLK